MEDTIDVCVVDETKFRMDNIKLNRIIYNIKNIKNNLTKLEMRYNMDFGHVKDVLTSLGTRVFEVVKEENDLFETKQSLNISIRKDIEILKEIELTKTALHVRNIRYTTIKLLGVPQNIKQRNLLISELNQNVEDATNYLIIDSINHDKKIMEYDLMKLEEQSKYGPTCFRQRLVQMGMILEDQDLTIKEKSTQGKEEDGLNNEDREKLVKILSDFIIADTSGDNDKVKNFFIDLLNKTNLPVEWRKKRLGTFVGDAETDARKFIDWAVYQGTNLNNPHYKLLGSFLEKLLPVISTESAKEVASLIVKYNLYQDKILLEKLKKNYIETNKVQNNKYIIRI
jgi:hypothetical protein